MEILDKGIDMEVLCSMENLSVDLLYVQPDAVESSVYHKHSDEVLYVLEGEIEVSIKGVSQLYKKGGYVIIPKTADHMVKNTGGTVAEVLAICSPRYSADDTVITGKQNR